MAEFREEMIAPCGLDCSVCLLAHWGEKPCRGCMGPDEYKPAHCAEVCGIIRCEKRLENGYRFCCACPDYPCEAFPALEERYLTQYPLVESTAENLKCIKDEGMEAFLKKEEEKWTCKACGGIISVHTGQCTACHAQYGDAEKAVKF